MNILVVDEDASVRESVGRVLMGAGYQAPLAADGQEALEWLVSHPIDLLLLDLGLPLKSGWDIFGRITSENPLLPIIITTGQVEQSEVALMEKPLDAPRLLQTIRELLAEPKEVRLHRLCGRGGDVRDIPSRNAQFLKQLREQYEKPYRFKVPPLHEF